MGDYNTSSYVTDVVDPKNKQGKCFKNSEESSYKTQDTVFYPIKFDTANRHESTMSGPEEIALPTIRVQQGWEARILPVESFREGHHEDVLHNCSRPVEDHESSHNWEGSALENPDCKCRNTGDVKHERSNDLPSVGNRLVFPEILVYLAGGVVH